VFALSCGKENKNSLRIQRKIEIAEKQAAERLFTPAVMVYRRSYKGRQNDYSSFSAGFSFPYSLV
jgi:hypothetical protein